MLNKKRIRKKIKGFLSSQEGKSLYKIAKKASKIGPCLEIGSYCGKSASYIGTACKEESTILFSIDHHKGSEEQMPGEQYFDPSLFDYNLYMNNTLNVFIKNMIHIGLEDVVIPIVSRSNIVAKNWCTKLGMVFIDGSHSYNSVMNDYILWSKHILPLGYLIFHDIFKNPNEGGQAPYKIYKIAIASGNFIKHKRIETLGILQRKK